MIKTALTLGLVGTLYSADESQALNAGHAEQSPKNKYKQIENADYGHMIACSFFLLPVIAFSLYRAIKDG